MTAWKGAAFPETEVELTIAKHFYLHATEAVEVTDRRLWGISITIWQV